VYNEGQVLTREVFILELALLVSGHMTERSMLHAYEAIGVGSSSRISRVLAEPPRSLIARTGGITERAA
jgi:hypothetical protein